MIENRIANLIRLSLWGSGVATADKDTYNEMKLHAIAVLPASCLSSLGLLPELEIEWKKYILQQIAFNAQSAYEQERLPISVPYVILKGSSAAQYYPYPNYRTMGDIDIMTRREDINIACKQLVAAGYRVTEDIPKEISLKKGGICIDLHRQFASLNNPDYVKYLDDLIIENINPSHVLPDMINGLVILEHINQHLEGGLGLRQIIDWMMFVDKCLPDEKWPEFSKLAMKIGLEKLAIISTHMCEIYLGLTHREWCSDADSPLCRQLMDYVMACGNFGNKKTSDMYKSERVFAHAKSPIEAIRYLQKRGITYWKAASEHRVLTPFAWIYQLFHYASEVFKRDHSFSRIKAEYNVAKKNMELFEALGVKTIAKGLVVYRDGKYYKE